MTAPLLAIEVGNSRWKAARFAPGDTAPAAVLRVAHGADPAGPLRAFLAESAVPARSVWAGVNPAGAAALLTRWPSDLAPPPDELPRSAVDRLLSNRTREPHRVGTDRLLNALAAARLAPAGGHGLVSVADCGTATTVDLVDCRGGRPAFAGGAILPGAELCVRALHDRTALLPAVDLRDEAAPEDGFDTAAAIRRGVLEMQAAAVERLLSEAGGGGAFPVLTGGAAGPLRGRFRSVKPAFVPHLTLCGLAIAARCER